MAKPIYKTSSLVEKDQACIWHPYTQAKTAPLPILITHAKGAHLYSEDGKDYLDGISSWWVNLHGHTHPYIVEKIKFQAEKLEHVIFADFTHAPAIELASRLLSIVPGKMSKIFYSDNGSTAVEVAIKMSLQFWHNLGLAKTKIICFKNSYHGDTFGAMSVAGRNEFNRPFWKNLFDVETIDAPFKGQEDLALSQLESIIHKGDAACFIFEPLVLGSGGMRMYPSDGLDKLIKLCQEHDVLCIADEVMTGFGRTGSYFACDKLTMTPDLICLSKGLTGGFLPLGATACTKKVYEAFLSNEFSQAFLHGHSYTANPLACSSALASLDLLLESSCTMQRQMIEHSHQAFCKSWSLHPNLKRCEYLGTILALEYRVEDSSYFHTMRDRLSLFFLNKGILLRPLGNVIYVLPPYCIQKDALQWIYDQIIQTLEGTL